MQLSTFRPRVEALEERTLLSHGFGHITLVPPTAQPAARCIGFLLVGSKEAIQLINNSRFNVALTITWGDDIQDTFILKRGLKRTITHDFSCGTDTDPTITFDKAAKAGYQAKAYRLSLGSPSSPTRYKFINVTYSLSGPGADLRHLV
jgi:hypothetical protein